MAGGHVQAGRHVPEVADGLVQSEIVQHVAAAVAVAAVAVERGGGVTTAVAGWALQQLGSGAMVCGRRR